MLNLTGDRRRHPVKVMGGERLIELDEAARIEAELSAELPAVPDQAAAIAKHRLSQGGADLQRRIAQHRKESS